MHAALASTKIRIFTQSFFDITMTSIKGVAHKSRLFHFKPPFLGMKENTVMTTVCNHHKRQKHLL